MDTPIVNQIIENDENGIGTTVVCAFRTPESNATIPVEWIDDKTVHCMLKMLGECNTSDCLGIGRLDPDGRIISDLVLNESYVRSTTRGMEKI